MAKRKKPASKPGAVRKPRNWDKAVSVAYLRLLGASQKASAKEAGCAQRSIVDWEKAPWWKIAQAEARERWLQGGDTLAMRGILRGLADQNEYAQMSRYWADRRIPELKPPKQRKEVSGPDGGPVPVLEYDIRKLSDEELDEYERLLDKSTVDESES